MIAKLCDHGKQHFATHLAQTRLMAKKDINLVVAEALKFFMGSRWNYSTLAREAGVAPNTVKNYCAPLSRAGSASGKSPSAKLTELSKIADVLGIEVADLVTDASSNEDRLRFLRWRAGNYFADHGVLPDWAPKAEDDEFRKLNAA